MSREKARGDKNQKIAVKYDKRNIKYNIYNELMRAMKGQKIKNNNRQ